MTTAVAYSQFLFANGVPRKTADAVGSRIMSKIKKRQPLSPHEVQLTAAFLDRPNASAVAEQHVGLAILTSNLRSQLDDAGAASGRVPAHTPEWRDLNDSDPGARVVPSQTKVLMLAPAAPGKGGQSVRALSNAIEAQFTSQDRSGRTL